MANGANDDNGQFGGNTAGLMDPTQPQDQKQQKPGFLARIGEHAAKGFLAPIIKGAGETVQQALMGPGGRRELYREEQEQDVEKEKKFEEHEKEEGAEHEQFLGQLSEQANRGQPMTPDQTNTLLKMGFGKEVIGAINSQAQNAQQSFMQMDKDFKSGAYGNPKDQNTQEFYNFMKLSARARPELVPVISEFMKNQSEMRLANYKAVLKQVGDIFNNTLVTKRELTVEGARAADARSLQGVRDANANARQQRGFTEQEKLQGMRNTAATDRQERAEKLHERLNRYTAGLKGAGVSYTKSLGNLDTAVKTVLGGKIGGENGTPITTPMAHDIIDNANATAVTSNPNMTIMQAMSNMAFYSENPDDPSDNEKSFVGKGIDGFMQDMMRKKAVDADQGNTFLKYYYDHVANNPDQQVAMRSLVSASAFLPPGVREMILNNARHFGSLMNEAQPAGGDDADDGGDSTLSGSDAQDTQDE